MEARDVYLDGNPRYIYSLEGKSFVGQQKIIESLSPVKIVTPTNFLCVV